MKIIHSSFVTILLLFAYLPIGLSCSCFGPPTFCETIDNNSDLLVIRGKKIADVEYGMDVEILEVFSGVEERSVIRVWGDNGFLCRVYTSGFPIGEPILFALDKIETTSEGLTLEQAGEYTLSICGKHYAFCNSEEEDVSQCLGKYACQCTFPNLTFYPNPSTEKVYLDLAADAGIPAGTISIFTTSGQELKVGIPINQVFQNGRIELDVSMIPSGVYFVKIDSPDYCGEKSVGKVVVL